MASVMNFELACEHDFFIASESDSVKKKRTKRKSNPVLSTPMGDSSKYDDGAENSSEVESLPPSPYSTKPLASLAFGSKSQSNPTAEEAKKNVSFYVSYVLLTD